jgi:hypothetical protein
VGHFILEVLIILIRTEVMIVVSDQNRHSTLKEDTMEVLEFLNRMLAEGRLASRYEDHLQKLRMSPDSFYNQVLKKSGREAAEQTLRDVDETRHTSMFASLIVPITQGLISLSRVTDERTLVLAANPRDYFYGMRQHLGSVIFFNTLNAPGCGCVQPKGTDLFSTHGRLGLQAVTLTVGTHQKGGSNANLGIVLSPHYGIVKNHDTSRRQDGYNVLSFDLFGFTNWSRHTPYIIDSVSYLKYTFGLCTADDLVGGNQRSGGHPDDMLGFPGAYDYLAKVLPDLGPYLSDLADKLSKEHTHK